MFVYIVGAKWAMCGWWWWQWLDAGKVGIIISLTLNKWPSRVWRDPELRSGFGTGRGFLRGTARCCPPPERKNFRITHLCAIFKLTIVNFAIVGCLAFLFFTFLLSIRSKFDRLPFRNTLFLNIFFFFGLPYALSCRRFLR